MATLVISYARVDQPLVRGVVKLLRAAMSEIEDAVYWDDDFEPGEAWSAQIRRSIDGAPQLFVFWCAHSAASPQVQEELTYALNAGKVIVPVLLDDTCLSGSLTALHGVDLRTAVRHVATRRWLAGAALGWRVSPAPGGLRDHSAMRWLMPGLVAAALLALSLFAWRAVAPGDAGAPTVAEARDTPGAVMAEAAEDVGRKAAPPNDQRKPPLIDETANATTPPPSTSSGPPVTSGEPAPNHTQIESPAADGRPLMLPSALLLALVALIGMVVWKRRRSKYASSTAGEATAPDLDLGAPVLGLDQPSQDAVVREFRRYLRVESAT